MNMNMNNPYSMMGANLAGEEALAVKMLNKCILNTRNAINFYESGLNEMMTKRVINSLQLMQEMDMMLNRDIPNPLVDQVEALLVWVRGECEAVIDGQCENPVRTLNGLLPVFENLMEGFKGRG